MTPSLEIEPGPHWWEASALTTPPPLLAKIHNSNTVIATKRPATETLVASLAKRSSVAAADESQPTQCWLFRPLIAHFMYWYNFWSRRAGPLCRKNTPPGKWFLGDELPEQITEIAEVNKMANKLGSSQISPEARRGGERNTSSGRGCSFNLGQGRKLYF